ncbi:MAG TPA: acyl-CoA dehydrogenase [Gaiellaceae bacterium]|nr:acyl-CoA dehydrogenase [Gaiellaceae bacterium]
MATTTAPADLRGRLQTYLDGENAAVRDQVREWLSQPENAPRPDLPMDEHREVVLEWAKELASEGSTAIGFPVEFGGENDVNRYVAGFETLAFGDLSLLVKCGVHFGLFGGAVLHLGTRRHHERYLPGVIDVSLPGCFGMTETGHGSNVQALRTTATYDPDTDEIVVHTPDEDARKDWIGNSARHGRMCSVFAQLIVGGEERGVHCVLVPIRDEDGTPCAGVTIEDCGAKLGLDGVDNGRITFDHVRVPRENLLDRYATVSADGVYESPIENPTKRFFTMLGTLVQGRVSVCGAAIGATKVAQVIAVRHALTRKQFGPPGGEEVVLMDYRTHQRRLLVPLATTYGLHFAQEQLVEHLHDVFTDHEGRGGDRKRRELETLAAGLKAVATWHATSTIQTCREACGGAGYLRANRFAALKADTDVFTTFEGDNTVLLQLCAKNLLTDYRDQFGELDPLGTAQFVASQVLDTVAERSAIREVLNRLSDTLIPGRDDERDLLARETQLDLFSWRQEHILAGAARRLRGGIESGREPFEVLVDCQDHVVDAARAWVDLVVLERFAAAVERCDDPAVAAVLDRLCSLYALSRIEAERGWYQEHGRLSSPRSKAVIKAVNALCADLRDDAGMLVEAFGVPETVLGDAVRVEGAGSEKAEQAA